MSAQCCPLVGGDEYDSPSCWTSTTPKARKEHVCCECNELIHPGDRYQHVTGIWDGAPSRYKTCLSCAEIRDHFACDGFLYERLWADIEENFFPEMRAGGPCMKGLSPAARGRLFERRLAWLGTARGRLVRVT